MLSTKAMLAANAAVMAGLALLATCATVGLAVPLVRVTAIDSGRVVVSWTMPPVTDGRGPIESFWVTLKWSATDSITHARPSSARSDTLDFPVGPVGVEVAGTACVVSVRRGLLSAPGCVAWSYTLDDAPPPSPTVDSVSVGAWVMAPGDVLDVLALAVREADLAVVREADTCLAEWASVYSSGDVIRARPGTSPPDWCHSYLLTDTLRATAARTNWLIARKHWREAQDS